MFADQYLCVNKSLNLVCSSYKAIESLWKMWTKPQLLNCSVEQLLLRLMEVEDHPDSTPEQLIILCKQKPEPVSSTDKDSHKSFSLFTRIMRDSFQVKLFG